MQKWKGETRGQSTEYGLQRDGRDVASPRPPCVGVQGEALPLPAGKAREVKLRFGCHSANGRDAVAPLPERQLGQHAVLPLPRDRGRRGAEVQVCS